MAWAVARQSYPWGYVPRTVLTFLPPFLSHI